MKLLRKRRSQKQGSRLGSVLVYGLRILVYFSLSFVIEPGRVVYDLFQSVRQGHSFAKTLVAAVVWSSLIAGTLSYLYFHFRTDQHEHWLVYAATLLLPRFWSWFVRPFLGLTAPPPSGDEFYRSRKWRELRYDILRERGAVCELCGSAEAPLHVDHIRPRSRYPHLALDPRNMQVLCADCNIGKGVRHEDDFRAS